MQREATQVQIVRNTQESDRTRGPSQEDPSFSGPSDSPWVEREIWIFLQEWEVVEYKIGHPGKKLRRKAEFLSRRLYKRGVRKSWRSCRQLMLSMMDLHSRICNERPRVEPLYSPYKWDLYKILGYKSLVPGVPFEWCGNPQVSVYPQPPMGMPSSGDQPLDSYVSASAGQLRGNPSLMMLSQDALVPSWDGGMPAIQRQFNMYSCLCTWRKEWSGYGSHLVITSQSLSEYTWRPLPL